MLDLAASFLGSGVTMGDGTDALNASLVCRYCFFYSFLIGTFYNENTCIEKGENMTLNTYLDEESISLVELCNRISRYGNWWSKVFIYRR